MDILIEVNIGREPAKSGVLPEQLEALLVQCAQLQNLRVKGLMAIPPRPEENRGNARGLTEKGKKMIRGAIFDVDGVLLNSMPVWEDVYKRQGQTGGDAVQKCGTVSSG